MTKPSLCLNMIVRNEEARIQRCLASVLPYVKAVCVLDTGSTDGTAGEIAEICHQHKVPFYIEAGEFKDFSQARNDAFKLVKKFNGSKLPFCQFALMVDADMQLVIEDVHAFDNLDGGAGSYDMMQKGGAISYLNRRLVNISWKKPPYVGVTHEYTDIPAHGLIAGAHFIDHADGSNRADKYPRDIALLEKALETEPNNGRYWYYLANTHRDDGNYMKAIDAYTTRINLGGWDEETHSAMMNRADCWKKVGSDDMFVSMMTNAYNFRPRRAEPLYELARHYREKPDQQAAALIFAKAGLNLKRPDDALFVNDFVYSHGLRYEYSIVGCYDDAERSRAMAITNDLALDPAFDPGLRGSARNNLFWSTEPLAMLCPTFVAKQITFQAPTGYVAMNPSIEEFGGVVTCNIRCVNYRMDEQGRYLINGTDGEANGTNPIDTRNFVVKLDGDMNIYGGREILWARSQPAFNLVTGLEDVRLWRHHGELHFNACVRELHENGRPQQVMGRLSYDTLTPTLRVADFKELSDATQCEKNWMHVAASSFAYRLGVMHHDREDGYALEAHHNPKLHLLDLSGSSQCIPFKFGFLCVVHEAITGPDGKRTYWHRFAWMNMDMVPQRISKPFVFFGRQIEFCAGLCATPDQSGLMLSFGVRDEEAWVATVSCEDVAALLGDWS